MDSVFTTTHNSVREYGGWFSSNSDDRVYLQPKKLPRFMVNFPKPPQSGVAVFHISRPVVHPDADNFGGGWLVSLMPICLHSHGDDTSSATTTFSQRAVAGEDDDSVEYYILPVWGEDQIDVTGLGCILECACVDVSLIEEIEVFDDPATPTDAARDRKRPRSQSE